MDTYNYIKIMIIFGFLVDEVGTCSIVESIHSYRDTPESPFPELTSQNAIDALEMMKTIKNEISSGIYYY